ncbi:hypothetical protein BC826DRAFT_162149 [Russula brevipes]|nr:hypothetical protein BC826DRAFT_162149 [Russula brevipes]
MAIQVSTHNIRLCERIYFFLQRLNSYTQGLLTPQLTELLAMILAEILFMFPVRRINIYLRLLLGPRWTRLQTSTRILRFLVQPSPRSDPLLRLDTLMKEADAMVATVRLQLTHKDKRAQLRREAQRWLTPPDPDPNYYAARNIRHTGTAEWFIQGSTFHRWKNQSVNEENKNLLWICGNPGTGKTILCSTVIEDIVREERRWVAYYYFDIRDVSKRDLRGLLASLLHQLSRDSDNCADVLYKLYHTHRDGSEQPNDRALIMCLQAMLKCLGQDRTFIIVDALDECPGTTGSPSARKEVLDFLKDITALKNLNLSICVTSRPEHDIQTALNPLVSASYHVSLHEEAGQRDSINSYVQYFVRNDEAMRSWSEEDKQAVISLLSERNHGVFRWVVYQLDALRQSLPSNIRQILDDLPVALDDMYERILQEIPEGKWPHTRRLFQCLIAARRPLHVEELAEIFAIKFDPEAAPNLVEGCRPKDPENALFSACSTLIKIVEVEDNNSRVVQFSHVSVKQFLTSNRLRTSNFENIRRYHISLDDAHTTLARTCLVVLLLGESVGKKRPTTLPLASYAAQYWIDHAKFGDVASQIQDAMESLFDQSESFLEAWNSTHDIDRHED